MFFCPFSVNYIVPSADRTRCDDLIVQLDNFGADQMKSIIQEFNIKSPLTGNELSDPMEFNLMFQASESHFLS